MNGHLKGFVFSTLLYRVENNQLWISNHSQNKLYHKFVLLLLLSMFVQVLYGVILTIYKPITKMASLPSKKFVDNCNVFVTKSLLSEE